MTSTAGASGIAALCLVLVVAGIVSSQASGATYFLPAGVTADGVVARDAKYLLVGQIGEAGGGSGGPLSGSGHVLQAGFSPVIAEPVTGTVPWPMAVRPWFVDLAPAGEDTLVLHGAELGVGGLPGIRVAGKPTAVMPISGAEVAFVLPGSSVPGWQRVDVTTPRSAATLLRGLGVRPLLTLEEAALPDRTVRLTYHGHTGDQLWLGVSLGLSPIPTSVPPFHHSLYLDLNTFMILGIYFVSAPDGRLGITLPPPGITNPIQIQGLVFSSAPYAPGSFTNVVGL